LFFDLRLRTGAYGTHRDYGRYAENDAEHREHAA
jgi:hypothetical protein